MFSNIALAATLVASATALPATLATRFADDYVGYTGDGSVGAGWPSAYSWGSYDQLWDSNVSLMEKSCGWNNWGADNLADEINGIKNAIQQVSGETGVDARLSLPLPCRNPRVASEYQPPTTALSTPDSCRPTMALAAALV